MTHYSNFAKQLRPITVLNLHLLLSWKQSIYKSFFAHPYAAWERGSNERHNGLLRRIIPKGTPIRDVSEATLRRATDWCNALPCKILNYRTPQEVFIEEVNKLPGF